ncbi:MAG: hypothetical protein R6W73_00645 [Candidatus Saliniplasma sp.]
MFRSRKSAIVVLLVVLVILFVWSGSAGPEPEKGHYPSSKDVVMDYEDHVGEEVEIGGKVLDADPLTIEVEYGDESVLLEVINVDEDVEEGDRVSVFGTLRDDNTITAENVIVRPLINWYYMYGVSAVAAIWLLFRLITQWEYTSKGFRPREEPLDIFKRGDHG